MRTKYTTKRYKQSKYNPAVMIPLVLKLMSQGASKNEVALKIYEGGVTPATLWHWRNKYPEFASALQEGTELCQGWWERIGRKNIANNTFNTGMYVVQMANRFNWTRRDAVVQTVQGAVDHKHDHQHTYNFGALKVGEIENLRGILQRAKSKDRQHQPEKVTNSR